MRYVFLYGKLYPERVRLHGEPGVPRAVRAGFGNETARTQRKLKVIFGNMVTTFAIAEGVSCLTVAVMWVHINANPTTLVEPSSSSAAMPMAVLVINCLIMFLFEVFITDWLVAYWSTREHAKAPEKCINVSEIWAKRSKSSYRRFGWKQNSPVRKSP